MRRYLIFLVLSLGFSLIIFSGCGRKGDPIVPEPKERMSNVKAQSSNSKIKVINLVLGGGDE